MKTLMILENGFEDIEAIATIDVLRRGQVELTTTSPSNNQVTSAHGLTITTDMPFNAISTDDFQLLIFPGGTDCAKALGENPNIIKLVKDFCQAQKLIAAICASPALILGKNGFLTQNKATCYPAIKEFIPNYQDNKVVHDGNFITSQGPGTALDFAFYLLEHTQDAKIAQKVKEGMLL